MVLSDAGHGFGGTVLMASIFSTFLFACPSFFEGAGRLVDFGNFLSEYNKSPSSAYADDVALRADWNAVAMDLNDAIKKVPSLVEKLTT